MRYKKSDLDSDDVSSDLPKVTAPKTTPENEAAAAAATKGQYESAKALAKSLPKVDLQKSSYVAGALAKLADELL